MRATLTEGGIEWVSRRYYKVKGKISTISIVCEKRKCAHNFKGLCMYPTKIPQELNRGKTGVSTRILGGLKLAFNFGLIISILLTFGGFVALKPIGGPMIEVTWEND
jgi:hypothetical protein